MHSSYFYTETAFHHQGGSSYLEQLIDASAEAGADGIKFQVLTDIDDFVSTKHTAYQALSSYCFTLEQWSDFFNHALSKGLDIILMPLNIEALKLIDRFKVKYIDIHSVSFNDLDLLDGIRKSKVDVILGVGGRSMEEIEKMIFFFAGQLKILMVGFQSFPSKLEEIRLGKIANLKDKFPNLSIGYADHSAFDNEHSISSNDYARFLGATIFEKHISIEEGVTRVDSASAISKEKIKSIIDRVRFIESQILLSPAENLKMTASELTYRDRQLRCVAATSLPKGKFLDKVDIRLKLVDTHEATFSRVEDILGRKLNASVQADDVISVNLIK
jgi:N,N'-diacetyllegionaminate synthase